MVTVGVDDLIVIVTPDATLVANKNDEESVRAPIVELQAPGLGGVFVAGKPKADGRNSAAGLRSRRRRWRGRLAQAQVARSGRGTETSDAGAPMP